MRLGRYPLGDAPTKAPPSQRSSTSPDPAEQLKLPPEARLPTGRRSIAAWTLGCVLLLFNLVYDFYSPKALIFDIFVAIVVVIWYAATH
jgi:hypothetical protein